MKITLRGLALSLVACMCMFEVYLLSKSAFDTSYALVAGEEGLPSNSSLGTAPTTSLTNQSRRTLTKNAYICITGQLSRLELENKIRNLISPLHNRGYSLYVGIALSDTPPKFSNNNSGAKMRLRTSIYGVIQELQNVKGVKEVRHFKPSFDDLRFNPKYDKILGNYTEVNKKAKRIIQKNYLNNQPVLAENNARQFRTLQYCNNWPGIAKNTDFLVRVREDVLVYRMDLNTILRFVSQGAVVTSKCDAWRGINDKIAFAPSTRLSDFFMIPYREYLVFDNKFHKVQKLNAETFYRIAYNKNGFNLRSTESLVATKAMTSFKSNSVIGKDNCSVVANPFILSLSKQCPPDNLDVLAYETKCWI
jgi:hypothetical protein